MTWHRRPPRRLARRYAAVAASLVAGAVLATGAIDLRLSYVEQRAALADLQGQQADAAAARISQFVGEVDRELSFLTAPRDPDAWREDFRRALFRVDAITDVRYVDPQGIQRIVVSRVAPDITEGTADRSLDPAFRAPAPDRPYYGPLRFVDGTEPHMDVARRSGDGGAILVDLHLALIRDVVASVNVGRRGQAFAVDQDGVLVAHPDLTLVLGRRDLSRLPHVKARSEHRTGNGITGRDLDGTRVLASFRIVEPLDWAVYVQQPLEVAFEPVEDGLLRTGALLIVAVLLASAAALLLGRRMVRPLVALQAGAARIGAGDLDQRIDVHSRDELEALAEEFNRMSQRLRTSLAELQASNEQLRESRSRIVTAADDARRRLERDLHDGSQQHLVAVSMKLRLARRAVDAASPVASMLDELHEDVQRAVVELRTVAHGIYPPLLASGGLEIALPAAAKMAALPATVDVDTSNRYPQDVEATIYFCCVEALQNAAKHAGAGATARVRVWEDDRHVCFSVTDDGVGFNAGTTVQSHGFVNMVDRLGALEGTFSVVSSPGRGTSVSGSIPFEPTGL